MLLLAWHATQPLARAGRAMAFEWQLDGEEGFLLDQALQLSRGRGIYPPISEEPYIVGNYPPVYPALWAALELVTGREASLAWGRLICLLAFVAIVALTFLMTWRASKRLALAPLAPLLFTVTYDWFDWIAYARVDIPAIAFAVGALAVMGLRDPEADAARPWWRQWLTLAAGLALLALFTKQTMLAAPLAIAVFLAWRDRRALGRFALWLLAPGAAIFFLLTLLTRGEYLRHLILYNANTFAWFQVMSNLRHLWFFQKMVIMALVLGAGAVAVLAFLDRRRHGREDDGKTMHSGVTLQVRFVVLVAAYAVFAAANLWAIGKEGSAPNYLLEVHLSMGLLVAAALGALIKRLECAATPREAVHVRLILAGVIAALTLHGAMLLMPVAPGAEISKAAIMFSRPTPTPEDAIVERAIEAEVAAAAPEAVLAEYPIYGLHLNARPVVQPFIMSQLAREGKWDPAPLLEDIRGGRFRWLLVTQELERNQAFHRWSPEFVEAFREAYVLRDVWPRLGGRERMFLYEYQSP